MHRRDAAGCAIDMAERRGVVACMSELVGMELGLEAGVVLQARERGRAVRRGALGRRECADREMARQRTQALACCMRGLIPEAAAIDHRQMAAGFAAVALRALQYGGPGVQEGAEADIAVGAGGA